VPIKSYFLSFSLKPVAKEHPETSALQDRQTYVHTPPHASRAIAWRQSATCAQSMVLYSRSKLSMAYMTMLLPVLAACTTSANESGPNTGGFDERWGDMYTVGDIGPGGGTVFYISPTTFTSTGSDCGSNCRHLEVAPAPTNGDVARTWASGENSETAVPGDATATAVGSGMPNTNAIVAQTGNRAESSAAVYAHEYEHGGKTDWHLPSGDELLELYLVHDQIGGLGEGIYWSSSETVGIYAWLRIFNNGLVYGVYKSEESLVRPVRAF